MVLTEASAECDAECTTKAYLAASLAAEYFVAERGLSVSAKAAPQPAVTSAGKVESINRPAVKEQQQPLEQVNSRSSSSSECRAV